MPLHIRRIATFLPERVCPVADLPELAAAGDAQRTAVLRLGVERVRDAGDLGEVPLAAGAATAALAATGTDPAQVDVLLLVQGRAPEHLLSSEATRVQRLVGATNAVTLGVGELGCVSSSAALAVCSGLFAANPGWRTGLVTMGARVATAARYRPPMTVLGDGGLAALVTSYPGGGFRLVDQILTSNGEYADLFRIRYRDRPASRWQEECTDPHTYSFRLALESRRRLADLNAELLARNGLRADQVRYVMQNLSTGAFAFWQEALDVELLPVCVRNLREYGHLGSADVLLNLAGAAPALRAGEKVLVMNSSPVAAWSSALFEYLPDDERKEGTPR
ncbi:3-oxoacyl-ACP synthase [Micromonospora sagamiensis]|uniref:3-oxoacyl-[acyl-carrier-protein] synthase-3 n=1 Tax=Micromonospora sagamiensis TaxID=47875 RepID=A0A562WGP2_9ACTN|nr:3-oxoacyl-ACP synthase [Micromonospora sagamiensis]TWJ29480.1 3-oxoacyl-[acyl-carrier-protein] synthase-3 [Micromonospora sagamiensis]BCL17492.1 3-oxoacyl-ACP synthase [Micromonospora sagamiensis]